MAPDTTIPLAPDIFWRGATLLGLLLLIGVTVCVLSLLTKGREPLKLQSALGLDRLPHGAFVIAFGMWIVLSVVLALGVIFVVIDILFFPVARDAGGWLHETWAMVTGRGQTGDWELRFRLAQLTALAAVLGAVIALPVTLNRLRLTREQTETAQEALFNQKITEAAADLHAQRQVTWSSTNAEGVTEHFNAWEDDIVRRNAAIDRLEGLLRERSETSPDVATAERLARLFSVYVRELSRKHPAKRHPWMDLRDLMAERIGGEALSEADALQRLGVSAEDADSKRFLTWTRGLTPRSDMQTACQALGRLTETAGLDNNFLPIDLSGANLQGVSLSGGDFRNAIFSEAQMQGAELSGAKMQGASFLRAEMQGAGLRETCLDFAQLGSAQMQGADLELAQGRNAIFKEVNLHEATLVDADIEEADFSGAQLVGAFFTRAQMRRADFSGADIRRSYFISAVLPLANLARADMEKAHLPDANMKGAYLSCTVLEGTDLKGAQLQGAILDDALMDADTKLDGVCLRAAALRSPHPIIFSILAHCYEDIFADGSIELPSRFPRPAHWADEQLAWPEFAKRWREWQRATLGMDPDNPE